MLHDSETALTSLLYIKLIPSLPGIRRNQTIGYEARFHISPGAAAFFYSRQKKKKKSHHCCMCPTTGHVFRHAIKRPHPQPRWIWKP